MAGRVSRGVLGAVLILVLSGCLLPGCTVFKRGSIVLDEGEADVHLGKAMGVIIETRTFIGFGFDEAHTDVRGRGTGEVELQAPEPNEQEGTNVPPD